MACYTLGAFFLATLLCLVIAGGPSFYPCPGPKAPLGNGVTCKEVKLPSNLCSACPLRDPHTSGANKGKFKDCANIYDTFQPACMSAMNKYVQANPCDKKRAQIMANLNGPNPSAQSRVQLDYMLYSVCEQCCDCIPIGASKSKDKGKWITDRGNCPAHAWYDICAIYPDVTHFVNIGQATPGKFIGAPKACPMLTKWAQSPAFSGWQKNPKTKIPAKLDAALASMLDAVKCSNPSVWNKCFNLESLQGNLGNPGDFSGPAQIGSSSGGAGGGGNTDTGSSTSGSGDGNADTGTNSSGGGNAGSSQPGECTGLYDYGCINWDSVANVCKSHGCKCFPDKPVKPDSDCVKKNIQPTTPTDTGTSSGDKNSGSTDGGNSNSGGNTATADSGNSNSDVSTTTPDSGTSNSGGISTTTIKQPGGCTTLYDYGCTNWDAAGKVCKSHGCKCIPGKPVNPDSSCLKVTKSLSTSQSSKSCFPIDAMATLRDGTPVAMTNLRIGDEVMAAPGVYSRVYLFTHRHGAVQTRQLRINLPQGRSLTISPGHHLHVNGKFSPASDIIVGDSLQTVDGFAKVTKVEEVWATGLYNPHTLAGTIVVDGVVCSTYTREVDDKAAHALLSPIRAAFRAGAVSERRAAAFMQYGASLME